MESAEGLNIDDQWLSKSSLLNAKTGVIQLTFLLHENKQHPNRCEILLDSYCDYTSSGYEAEIAEEIAVAAVKALRLEQSVCVVREGSRATVKGRLRLYTLLKQEESNQ